MAAPCLPPQPHPPANRVEAEGETLQLPEPWKWSSCPRSVTAAGETSDMKRGRLHVCVEQLSIHCPVDTDAVGEMGEWEEWRWESSSSSIPQVTPEHPAPCLSSNPPSFLLHLTLAGISPRKLLPVYSLQLSPTPLLLEQVSTCCRSVAPAMLAWSGPSPPVMVGAAMHKLHQTLSLSLRGAAKPEDEVTVF